MMIEKGQPPTMVYARTRTKCGFEQCALRLYRHPISDSCVNLARARIIRIQEPPAYSLLLGVLVLLVRAVAPWTCFTMNLFLIGSVRWRGGEGLPKVGQVGCRFPHQQMVALRAEGDARSGKQ